MTQKTKPAVPQVGELLLVTAQDLSKDLGDMNGRLRVDDVVLCTEVVNDRWANYRLLSTFASFVAGRHFTFACRPIGKSVAVLTAEQTAQLNACDDIEDKAVLEALRACKNAKYEPTQEGEPLVTIRGKAEATFMLTAEEADVLLKASQKHYDATCREASDKSGFIAHWHWISTASDLSGLGRDLKGTFYNFDVSLKCMEYPVPGITPEQNAVREKLMAKFIEICHQMNDLYGQWQYVFDPSMR